MPPYRGRVPLSAMHQRGYIAPSARLYHRHLHLGPHVFIGDHVVPDGAVVQGVPARVVMLRSELASGTLSEQDGLSFPKTHV